MEGTLGIPAWPVPLRHVQHSSKNGPHTRAAFDVERFPPPDMKGFPSSCSSGWFVSPCEGSEHFTWEEEGLMEGQTITPGHGERITINPPSSKLYWPVHETHGCLTPSFPCLCSVHYPKQCPNKQTACFSPRELFRHHCCHCVSYMPWVNGYNIAGNLCSEVCGIAVALGHLLVTQRALQWFKGNKQLLVQISKGSAVKAGSFAGEQGLCCCRRESVCFQRAAER